MNLLLETLIISLLMAFFCLAPRLLKWVSASSQILLLIGTGSLLGIYCFDLLPDVVEIGGRSSLIIMIAVWAIYSLVHTFHLHHHNHQEDEHCETETAPKIGFLMTSMVAHCLASGMFLALSSDLSQSIEHSVFWALMAHKGYEALSVSLVLQERVHSPRKLAGLTALYALSFPAGVFVTATAKTLFGGGASSHSTLETIAMIVASVAAGSLMGCMIHDFVIPSIKHVQRRRHEAAWVALGLAVTLGMMFAL